MKVPVKCAHCPHVFGYIEQFWFGARIGPQAIHQEAARWLPAGKEGPVIQSKGVSWFECVCHGKKGRRRYPVVMPRLFTQVIRDGFLHPVLLGQQNRGLPTIADRLRSEGFDPALLELSNNHRQLGRGLAHLIPRPKLK